MDHPQNPLIDDRDVAFLLYDVHAAHELCTLPAFAEHSRETFDITLSTSRRLARDVLYPAYRPMDAEPPVLSEGRVRVHPCMHSIYPRIVDLGLIAATRPPEVGGQNLPLTVANMALGYLFAANLGAAGYAFLTAGAAHLIEAFGSDELKATYMTRMYAGEWCGTMALSEPQAGSSLADVKTSATPTAFGHYLLRGSKIFISGG